MGWACLGVLGLLGPLVQSALSAEHMLGASFCCWSWGSGGPHPLSRVLAARDADK